MDHNIKDRIIEEEMKTSFLDYAMSIIVSRALPDVRDGLKPVHRRILFTMKQMGLMHNKPFAKCAKITGTTMGTYHPHGNAAIYDALVRLAQDFLMRYPLIKGQGNFGSIDGDPPAAERYTEAKFQKLAEELLDDIDKETVDFTPNYDGTEEEPVVLPARIPNLLINGSSGIAVGMATNIPPHNLTEVCDAIIHLVNQPDATITDLMQFVKGPDFPTGGIIEGAIGIKSAYTTGKGKVYVTGRVHHEETAKHSALIITEIPFMLNRTTLIEQIAELVKEGKIEGIRDIRNESSRDGMRIVVVLKKDANPGVVENQLLKYTRLRQTFGMNMLALVKAEPRRLSLKEILQYFIDHRKEVLLRKATFELRKAQEKAHRLEGLEIALNHIDAIVAMIKAAKSAQEAEDKLIAHYNLSQIQARTILEMQLQRLTALEQDKIRTDLMETRKLIQQLKEFLESPTLVFDKIKEETTQMKTDYGDKRKTELVIGEHSDEIMDEDLIEKEDMTVTISASGYIKRTPLAAYKTQNRGGRGVLGSGTKEDDFVEQLFVATTHDYLLFFTNKAKVYWQKVYELPEASRQSKGKNIVNILPIEQDEKITSVVPVSAFVEDKYLLIATKNGIVKKTPLNEYSRPRQTGIIACTIDEGDQLIAAHLTTGSDEVILLSKEGNAVRFEESQARPMGRTSRGVTGMRFGPGDEVVSMLIRSKDAPTSILTITEFGYGKQSPVDDYRLISRGGKGVINIKTSDRNGRVIAGKLVTPSDELMIISKNGIAIRIRADGIPTIGRNTQGVRIMRLEEADTVKAVATIAAELEE